ncbi:MAG TPA: exo-alpha-sialidase, partial [Burkholderiaceae bacterium]|nr:exo-alpha-sialidase [Burkholderiaceae bacterium]
DGQRSTLHALLSADAGATFRENEIAITSGASDQPRLLARSGRFYVVWNTARESLRVIPLP